MSQEHRKRRPRARATEGEELAIAGLAQSLLHRLDVGGTDAADDRDEAVGDARLRRRCLDIGRARLARLLAVRPVIDQYRNAAAASPATSSGAIWPLTGVRSSSWRIIGLSALSGLIGAAGAGAGAGGGTAAGATGAGVAAPPFSP